MQPQRVNEELKRVLVNQGTFKPVKTYLGKAELENEFDFNFRVKTDGNIFVLQTQYGAFECELNFVVWQTLWNHLGDVPINEDGEIQESFLHFEAGTDREDIWHWFEWFFDITLGDEIQHF